jgi:hypothetical protein
MRRGKPEEEERVRSFMGGGGGGTVLSEKGGGQSEKKKRIVVIEVLRTQDCLKKCGPSEQRNIMTYIMYMNLLLPILHCDNNYLIK